MVGSGCCSPSSGSHWPTRLHYRRRKNSFLFLQFLFFCRNIADPESGSVAPFFSWLGLRPHILTGLKSCVCLLWPSWAASAGCLLPTGLSPAFPRGAGQSLPKSSLFFDSLKLAYRQLLSLFTAFTLVQLRSLLRSKCWQAVFINHVRLNVFKCMYLRKNNHALVLFLFSSRPWGLFFLLCFPWLTQSGAKDSVPSENWCFRLRPAFWGGEEAWRRV